jgi:putative ATPase
MKELGYGAGYQYAHDVPEAYIPQEYLPEALQGTVFYEPGSFGFEREIAKRLAWWAERRERASPPGDATRPPEGTDRSEAESRDDAADH